MNNQELEKQQVDEMQILSSYEKAANTQIKFTTSRSLIEDSGISRHLKQLEFSLDSKECLLSSDTLSISRTTFNQLLFILDNVGRISYERRMYRQAIRKMINCLRDDLVDSNCQQKITDLLERIKTWRDDVEVKTIKKKDSNRHSNETSTSINQPHISINEKQSIEGKVTDQEATENTKSNSISKTNAKPTKATKGIEKSYEFYKYDESSKLVQKKIKEDIEKFIQSNIESNSAKISYERLELDSIKQIGFSVLDILICFGFSMISLINNPLASTEILYQYIYEVLNVELKNTKISVGFKKIIVENVTLFCNELVDCKEGNAIKLIYVWGGVFYLLNFHQVLNWKFLKIEQVLKSKDHMKCFFDILSICLQYFEKEEEILKDLMQNKVILDNWEVFKIAYNEYSSKV